MEGVFDGFTLHDVVLFLRFLYHPDDATPANLAALRPHLTSLALMAHKFDVPGLLAGVAEQLLPSWHPRGRGTIQQLLDITLLVQRGSTCQAC